MFCNVASRGEVTQSVDGQTKSNLNGTLRVVFITDGVFVWALPAYTIPWYAMCWFCLAVLAVGYRASFEILGLGCTR